MEAMTPKKNPVTRRTKRWGLTIGLLVVIIVGFGLLAMAMWSGLIGLRSLR